MRTPGTGDYATNAPPGARGRGKAKTKISIRLHNTVLEYFRDLVDKMGGGNYQTLINDALLEYVHRRSTLDVVRQVVREELGPYRVGSSKSGIQPRPQKTRRR
ncbi:MAG: hypothetical protein DMG09_02155 [Acidobacteria bacterium]|nr:MAG: hypothetical protein DMG09_02155 [Acidobacteriota bacterium]